MKNKILIPSLALLVAAVVLSFKTYWSETSNDELGATATTPSHENDPSPDIGPTPTAPEAPKKQIEEYHPEGEEEKLPPITITQKPYPTQMRLALCKKRALHALDLTESEEDQLLLIWIDFESQLATGEIGDDPAEVVRLLKGAVAVQFSDEIFEKFKTVMSLYPAEIVLIDMWDALASANLPLTPSETWALMEANQKALSSRGEKLAYPKIPASLEGLSESEVRELKEEIQLYREHENLRKTIYHTDLYNLARQIIGNARVELVLESKANTPTP